MVEAVMRELLINLSSIQKNLSLFRSFNILAVVKANAYGTDLKQMTHFLRAQGITLFGVTSTDELAVTQEQSVLLHACPQDADAIVHWNATACVSECATIDSLAQAAKNEKKQINVHLHINTGMHRAGCSPHDALSLAQQIDSNPHLKLAGLMTHFTSSEDPQHDSLTHEQEKLFSTCIQKIHAKKIYPRWLHAANTEGVRRFSFPQFNLVRIGIGLYSPHPTLSIRSQIVSLTDALPGDTVGYGRTHQITHKTKVGVIPLGYSDGFETALGTERTVWIDRIPLPVIGKVCMDFSMIDLTNYPQAQIGQTVTIPLDLTFQNGYPPPHAKMTAIGPRVKRIFYE